MSSQSAESFHVLPPKTEERCLIEYLQTSNVLKQLERPSASQVVAFTTGRAQAADYIANRFPNAEISVWYLDAHHASSAIAQSQSIHGKLPDNLRIVCQADLPDQQVELALASLSSSGESELARDVLQQLFHHLAIEGKLVVSVDNPQDTWVQDLLKTFEKKKTVLKFKDATLYLLTKSHQLKKQKDYSCHLAFRDCDDLIQLVTRPGVFSHRQLDNGARQLLDAIDVFPESKILEIGCGSGSVSLGLAKRDASAWIHAVDSNARALDCLKKGMELNGITNISMELNHDGQFITPDVVYDMVVSNPPYYSDFKIAAKFLNTANRSLRSGGRIVVVTKQPNWYEENLDRWFVDYEVFPSKRYFIASGLKA